MRFIILGIVLIVLSSCSNYFVKDAELKGTGLRVSADSLDITNQNRRELDLPVTLSDYAKQASHLSQQYVSAAGKTSTVQDVLSLLMVASAGKAVIGAVGDLTDKKIARLIVNGTAAGEIGKRAAGKKPIETMYTGAMRLNCISTAAKLGVDPWNLEGDVVAMELTKSSMLQVMIETRSGLVRDIANYGTLLDAFKKNVTGFVPILDTGARSGNKFGRKTVNTNLTEFIQFLSTCVDKGRFEVAAVTVPAAKANPGTGKPGDKPEK